MLLRSSLLLLALAILAAPSRVLATPRGEVEIPGVVRAGDVVTLRWSGVPGDADELELLLSLDGGRHFPLRVSPELDARERVWRWRVPNVPTSEARLLVRWGNEREEREAAVSEAFEIEGDVSVPLDRELVHEDGWWTGEVLPTRGGVGLAQGRPAWSAGRAHSVVAPERAPTVEPMPNETLPSDATSDFVASAPGATRPSAAPRFVPPRK